MDEQKNTVNTAESKPEVPYKDPGNKNNIYIIITLVVLVIITTLLAINGGIKESDDAPLNITRVEEGYEYRAIETYEDDVVADDEEGELLTFDNGEPINIPVIKVREKIKLEDIKDDTKPEAVFGEAASYEDEQAAKESATETAQESDTTESVEE